MYKVRVLFDDSRKSEQVELYSSYDDAVNRFLFYMHLALEFNCSVRCVNICHCDNMLYLFKNTKL